MAPQGATLDDILRVPGEACSALLVVLAGVQDPGNVGTILRTASAFGATGAVTTASGQSGTASPFSPKALRASAGAALHLPILAGMSLPILLTQLHVANVRTLAAVAHGREKTELGRIVVERLVIAGENRMRKQYQSNLPSPSSFP